MRYLSSGSCRLAAVRPGPSSCHLTPTSSSGRAGPAECREVRGRRHLLPAVGWCRDGTSRLLGWELRVQGWVLASHEEVGLDEGNHRQKGGGGGEEAQKENQPPPPKKKLGVSSEKNKKRKQKQKERQRSSPPSPQWWFLLAPAAEPRILPCPSCAPGARRRRSSAPPEPSFLPSAEVSAPPPALPLAGRSPAAGLYRRLSI